MDFPGTVWVITGASSGIGRRTALDVAGEGARICVAARREDRLASLVDELGGSSRGHSYVVTDVSKKGDARALATHVKATYGRCDVLVNNAGFTAEQSFTGPKAVKPLEEIMATNFFGAVHCTAYFLPLLAESAPSHIVNVASMAGRLAFPNNSAYCASKFALVGWSESLHFELAEQNVHVSVVEPGFIPTEGFPQEAFVGDRWLKYALGSEAGVSTAIRDAVAGRKMERVTPRWYYLFQLPRVLAPFAYKRVMTRLGQSEIARRTTNR